jgi:hypothetical protein
LSRQFWHGFGMAGAIRMGTKPSTPAFFAIGRQPAQGFLKSELLTASVILIFFRQNDRKRGSDSDFFRGKYVN